VYDVSDGDGLHPGHQSIRLEGRDYSAPGLYFVTICTQMKRCIFGRVAATEIELAALGKIVHASWIAIPSHFAHVNLHAFVIMPNHVHGIIEIGCQAGAQHAAPLQGMRPSEGRQQNVQAGSLSAVVRSFKAAVTRRASNELSWEGEIWQRNYYERVVRNGEEFSDASRYIAENPLKWEWDRENPKPKQVLTTEVNGAQHAAPLQTKTAPWNS